MALAGLPALRLRSVPFGRSTNDVFTARLDAELDRAAATESAVPKMIGCCTFTTRSLLRVLWTVA